MFDVIERLKSEWTDRYVVVDAAVPELARFSRTTGFVRTVNMNGRCLVEFDQFNNVGWYDIDPSYLTIVEKPLPKPAEETATKAKAKEAAPAAKAAAAKPAVKASAGRPSTADILAAARGKAAAGEKTAEKPAAKAGGRPSTADILAMARGKAAPAAPAQEKPPAPAVKPAETIEEPAAVEPPVAAAAPSPAAGPLPTTTAEKIAWCRAHDGARG